MVDLKQDQEGNRHACREFERGLSALLEGDARPEAKRHAETCPFCFVLLTDMELIQTEASALPLEEPPAHLWSGIRAKLSTEGIIRESETRSGWFAFPRLAHWGAPVGALAAMAAVAVVLLVPSSRIDHATTSAWLSLADRDAVAAQVIEEDSSLISTVAQLQKSFEAQQASLEPSVKQVYLDGLKSLDDSIRESRASVEREPGNTLARDYLTAAYTQKAEVLATALKFDVP